MNAPVGNLGIEKQSVKDPSMNIGSVSTNANLPGAPSIPNQTMNVSSAKSPDMPAVHKSSKQDIDLPSVNMGGFQGKAKLSANAPSADLGVKH